MQMTVVNSNLNITNVTGFKAPLGKRLVLKAFFETVC